MKNILLTGSNGFLGSYFKNKYSKKYNIRSFSFLKDNFKSLCLEGIETIIHLSALVHQANKVGLEEYERVNTIQTLELAKKAKNNGVRHFIFISTIAVYGIEVGIIKENTKCNPLTCYGKSKLKAEKEIQKLEDNNFKVSILRPPIINGYNAPGNMRSLINLINKTPVLPFGNIKNRRSMIYIGNLCFYLDNIIEKQMGGIFLVSDDKPLSTTELCRLIANSLNKKIYLIKVPFFASLLKIIKPSIHKRLFESLEIDNRQTIKKLFNDENVILPYRVDEGIEHMIKGEPK